MLVFSRTRPMKFQYSMTPEKDLARTAQHNGLWEERHPPCSGIPGMQARQGMCVDPEVQARMAASRKTYLLHHMPDAPSCTLELMKQLASKADVGAKPPPPPPPPLPARSAKENWSAARSVLAAKRMELIAAHERELKSAVEAEQMAFDTLKSIAIEKHLERASLAPEAVIPRTRDKFCQRRSVF